MHTNQHMVPLLEKLHQFNSKKPISFHVPGHKNGEIFPSSMRQYYQSILPIDLTELNGLDDLHAPTGVIADAERLAADFFKADHTFFLVGGSTVGNLAMILATCSYGDPVIVQRNCHKSIINGLELAGADPIFITPEYNDDLQRYTAPSIDTLRKAIYNYPKAKAIVLTYPDYFGSTYDLKEMIELAHKQQMPVLIDEAHGVHFSLGNPFPLSALELGADAVVHSAHKTLPAMTMASYLHTNSSYLSKERIAHFLQMLQSSSPSYPLLASLDVARYFLATMPMHKIDEIIESTEQLREVFTTPYWHVQATDDPLKISLYMEDHLNGFEVATLFEQEGIYPELSTYNQVLFIHGLGMFYDVHRVEKAVKKVCNQLKINENHATIKTDRIFEQPVSKLVFNYKEMERLPVKQVPLQKAYGHIAAEAIIPYPPGIPLVLKGEVISEKHVETIQLLLGYGATFQHRDLLHDIAVFANDL